ncbi:MAG TPA: zf-HC2 domain-containing protein, partial [Thermoanaerobaculia bacterium]
MTFDPRSVCNSSEVLGAFAEGRLGVEERKAVIAHLDTCEACRAEVALLADFVDDGAVASRRALTPRWTAAAAAILLLIGAAVLWRVLPRRDASPVAPLIAATGELDHRLVEPRLRGFAWAEYRPVRSAESDRSPERLKVLGAAGEVLQKSGNDAGAEAAHAAGVASLLIADPAGAVERFRAAVQQRPGDAAAWSDLAAAHYELAVKLGRTSHYPEAL